jgi:hypothetical protein
MPRVLLMERRRFAPRWLARMLGRYLARTLAVPELLTVQPNGDVTVTVRTGQAVDLAAPTGRPYLRWVPAGDSVTFTGPWAWSRAQAVIAQDAANLERST